MKIEYLRIPTNSFDKIFIVESRNNWECCSETCNKHSDLVLCLDFGLKIQLQKEGYQVQFLDHLVSEKILQPLNFKMHDFLAKWYETNNGEDLLAYKHFSIGDSLLLFIISETTYFCHLFFNIISLNTLKYNNLIVSVKDDFIVNCLQKAGLNCQINVGDSCEEYPIYFFPISKWIKEKTQKNSLTDKIKNIVANSFDFYHGIIDNIYKSNKKNIFIQKYFPTSSIIEQFKIIRSVQIILTNYTGIISAFSERRIVFKNRKIANNLIANLKDNFKIKRNQIWIEESYEISKYIYEIIDIVLDEKLEEAISKSIDIENYFKKNEIALMVPITNYWIANRLLMNYCKMKEIPVFMIINGLLNVSFIHDAKDSKYVNCYSSSIKENYFKNAENVYALGDPRMDKYFDVSPKIINRENPVILIGAAGYDSLDLNSYVSYEFDFLYDILLTISVLISEGFESKIIIKVRGNGYFDTYKKFVNEYFGKMNIEIYQQYDFKELVSKADLYISIFSQTLFEAACFQIPTIYYKKDTQQIHKPFDNNSELVTALNSKELYDKLKLFYEDDSIYYQFMDKEIIEKYIGFIDGKNTKRNFDFINKLIESN